MAKGGYKPGSGRPRKGDSAPEIEQAAASENLTPLEYMMRVVNDPTQDSSRRDRMAIAAAPFVHKRAEEGGKKDERQRAAEVASTGKYAPTAPPKASRIH